MGMKLPRLLIAGGIAAALMLTGGGVAYAYNEGIDLLPHPDGPTPGEIQAAEMGITITWTDEKFMCGDVLARGCYWGATGDISILSKLNWYQRNWVIFHEIGHALQARAGDPLSEEGADAYADMMTR